MCKRLLIKNGKNLILGLIGGCVLIVIASCAPKAVAEEIGDYETPDEVYEGSENEEDGFDENELKNWPEIGSWSGEEKVSDEFDDPCGEKARLAELPDIPNRFVPADDLFKYYRMTGKELTKYDLKPGTVYYMHFQPVEFSAFRKKDYFIIVDKVWEQKRNDIIGWFGDFTVRTMQYTDIVTREVNYKRALTPELRFYELRKIENVTDPSIGNQFA